MQLALPARGAAGLSAPPAEARAARFLVCPPDHYDAHFLFNPFMTYRERVDRRRARRQWRRLVRVLEEAGAQLDVLEPDPAAAALAFTADGALCYAEGRALVLRNDGPRGELEPPLFRAWLREHGYETEQLPPRHRLDGGNLLRLPGGDVLAGLKPHATGAPERYLARLVAHATGGRLWPVQLVDERHLHLDTVVGVLREDAFLVYRGGLAGGELPATGPLAETEIVEVGRDDAARFACNIVVAGDVVVTGPVSDGLRRRVERLGLHVERVDLSEFYKAGGGAKCLTLPLWKRPKGDRYG